MSGDDLVLVLRPGAMVRPRADGLVVRALLGEKFVRSPHLAARWSAVQPALTAGLAGLPVGLVSALVDTGAAVLVSPSTAASTVPWHRYALSWAHDPDSAIAAVSADRLRVTASAVESATITRSADRWGLRGVEVRPGRGCTIEHSGGPANTVVVETHGHHLVLRLAGSSTEGFPVSSDLSGYASPTRGIAAGTALLAALALSSGASTGWSRPALPVVVDADTLSLRAGDGWSSR